jgi:hypothetical protein
MVKFRFLALKLGSSLSCNFKIQAILWSTVFIAKLQLLVASQKTAPSPDVSYPLINPNALPRFLMRLPITDVVNPLESWNDFFVMRHHNDGCLCLLRHAVQDARDIQGS